MTQDGNTHNSNFWSGFLLGGLFGGLIVFILSTEEGKVKAKKLLKKSGEFLEQLEEKVPQLKDYWEEKQEEKKDEQGNSLAQLRKRFFTKNGRRLTS